MNPSFEPFVRLQAIAAPLDGSDIDTGTLFPSRFLRRPRSSGYAACLFHDLRFDEAGGERPGFVLAQPAYRDARILVTGANFACGSSREAAVYALVDAGFRCVIAPSFGDIFFSNCFRNGLLPVILPPGDVQDLRRQLHERPGAEIEVDLPAQRVRAPDGRSHSFEIDEARKLKLSQGLDDIDMALGLAPDIERFEAAYLDRWPWAR